MKLISLYGQIIDVNQEHAQILISQKSWKEYNEPESKLPLEKPIPKVAKKVRGV